MQNVMSKAWEIAREGANKFGGSVKEYFANALKIAWSIVKNMTNYASQVNGTLVKLSAPALEGSEKQVKWATDIRNKAVLFLKSVILTEEYESKTTRGEVKTEKRPVSHLVKALVSTEATESFFREMESKNLPASRMESAVESLNGILARHARMVDLLANADSKFWIDNRDNYINNHMFVHFKYYVATGVKNF